MHGTGDAVVVVQEMDAEQALHFAPLPDDAVLAHWLGTRHVAVEVPELDPVPGGRKTHNSLMIERFSLGNIPCSR
jgi:hypothetical protein